jgi:hypothetical protein
MLIECLRAGLERAHYELIEDEDPFYGGIPGVEGVWATGKTLAEARPFASTRQTAGNLRRGDRPRTNAA